MSKYSIQSDFLERHPGPYTRIDDQLRYAPIVLTYGLNFIGIKGKNSFAEGTIILTEAFLLEHFIVDNMKKSFNKRHPNGGYRSFPSSHTARAFVAATFMHEEFGHLSPWYSVVGYSFAAATGALRVVNNHHWVPDVLIGAAIGIMSTKLMYSTHKFWNTKWRKRRNKNVKVSLSPAMVMTSPGVHFQVRF